MALPPINYISSGPMAPEVSSAPARAVAASAGEIGDALSQVSRQGFELAEKSRKISEAGQIEAAFTQFNEDAAGFSLDLAKREDTQNWIGDWRNRQQEYKDKISQLSLSPQARAEADLRLAQWGSQRGIDFEKQAYLKGVQLGRAQFSNSIDYYRKRGEFGSADEAVINAHSAGLLSTPEKDAALQDNQFAEEEYNMREEARLDPNGTLKALEDPDFIKKNPRATIAGVERAKDAAREQQRLNTYNATERFNNGLFDGTISRPEQIEQLFPEQPAAVKMRMLDRLRTETTEREREFRKTPDYQNQVTGQVSAMLDRFNPENYEESAVDFFEADSLIRTLPEGPVKARLNFRLDEVRKGKLEQWETQADTVRNRLKSDLQAGTFGYGSARQPLQDVINDGLLNDRAKIASQGFSPEQTEMIASGKVDTDKLKDMGLSKNEIERLSNLEPGTGAQIEIFRELYNKRQGWVDDSTPPHVTQAFQAIKSGNTGSIEWPSRAAEEKVSRRYGSALSEFEKWFRANPNAKESEMEAKYYQLKKFYGSGEFRAATMPTIPGPNEAVDSLLPPKPDQ